MASSAGRDKLRSRGPRVFAFGSSTPRDLSHMNKVPPKLRSYDAKSADKPEGPNLHDYIVKARSLSREAGDSRNQFVFGSSTPRTLAHLDKIPQKQRVYDAKIPKKSATHSDFKAAPIRFNTPPIPIQKPASKKEENRHVITSKDDDIASEPDFVQDREEFMNEMRKHKQELEHKKSLSKTDSKNPLETQSPKESRQEHVKFAHAPEIAGNAQKAVRIRAETQEEPPVAVENMSANKMNDQIEVSQLLNEITPESVPAVESSDSQKSADVVGDLLAKVQKVAGDKTSDVAKTIKNTEEEVAKTIDQTVKDVKETKQEIQKQIAEKVDDITKSLEKSAKSLEESKDKIGEKIETTGNELKSAIETSASEVVKAGEKAVADVTLGFKKTFDATEQKLESTFSKLGATAETTFDDVKNGLTLRNF